MKMQDSYFVYIGSPNDGMMNSLSYSFLSAYDNMPVDIRLMGPVGDRWTPQIAKKLAKLTGNPIYVSFDTHAYGQSAVEIEEKVIEEFKTHVLNCAEQ
uniref:Uncharacterized protein n=1 Tax=Bracon brevicornis TaxID=1563983 RepID=A0A6V7KV88_9HYME